MPLFRFSYPLYPLRKSSQCSVSGEAVVEINKFHTFMPYSSHLIIQLLLFALALYL
jgi:hypothetical protein